jgi:hypothetical protein
MPANRRHISVDVKQEFLKLSTQLTPLQIEKLLGYKKRTINRVPKLYRDTGCVVRKPLHEGRPRILNAIDIAVGHVDISTNSG